MLKKTLIATATAGLIAAGALTSATVASAAPMYGGDPGRSIGHPGYPPPPYFRPHRICEPEFKRVSYWSYGHRHWRLIKVGERCHWVYPQWNTGGPHPGPWPHPQPGPHPGGPGPYPGGPGPYPGGPGPYPH